MLEDKEDKKITTKKLGIIFLFSLFSNFLASWFGYAMAHGQVFTQAILGLFIPFSNLFYSNALIEAKSFKDRIKLTIAAGIALSVGTTLMLLLQKHI